jgi:hypothetical protein
MIRGQEKEEILKSITNDCITKKYQDLSQRKRLSGP